MRGLFIDKNEGPIFWHSTTSFFVKLKVSTYIAKISIPDRNFAIWTPEFAANSKPLTGQNLSWFSLNFSKEIRFSEIKSSKNIIKTRYFSFVFGNPIINLHQGFRQTFRWNQHSQGCLRSYSLSYLILPRAPEQSEVSEHWSNLTSVTNELPGGPQGRIVEEEPPKKTLSVLLQWKTQVRGESEKWCTIILIGAILEIGDLQQVASLNG